MIRPNLPRSKMTTLWAHITVTQLVPSTLELLLELIVVSVDLLRDRALDWVITHCQVSSKHDGQMLELGIVGVRDVLDGISTTSSTN